MAGRAQLFVGRLSREVRVRDLEDIFEPYGRLLRCDIKYGTGMAYAFVDYDDRRDAEDAVKNENGRELFNQSIVVEWARGSSHRPMHSTDDSYRSRNSGHWARDFRDQDHDRYHPRQRSPSRSRSRSRYKRSSSKSPPRSYRQPSVQSGHGNRNRYGDDRRRETYVPSHGRSRSYSHSRRQNDSPRRSSSNTNSRDRLYSSKDDSRNTSKNKADLDGSVGSGSKSRSHSPAPKKSSTYDRQNATSSGRKKYTGSYSRTNDRSESR